MRRRARDPSFSKYYFVGDGMDIGGRPDPLAKHAGLFPKMRGAYTWDIEDGDAMYMDGVASGSLDFVHSSHCLEHLVDPYIGIQNWFRILAPGGHIITTVPDEDMYEQGVFPSTYNSDHKWTMTIHKPSSWSSKSVNLLDLLLSLGSSAEIVKIESIIDGYDFSGKRRDQTYGEDVECAIEFVVRKRPVSETEDMGRWRRL